MGKHDRKQKKQKERQERLRKEKHLRHFGPSPDQTNADAGPDSEEDFANVPVLPARFNSERALQYLHRAIEERGIETDEELQQFLAEYNQTGAGHGPLGIAGSTSPKAQAQELAYQAMEEADPAATAGLARRALELDAECVDALTALAETTSRSEAELIARLRDAVEVGERSLGARFFEENRGRFWGLVQTRPYMRARGRLAEALRRSKNLGEAIDHYEAMLDLNPNDNQGHRTILLGCYLAAKDLEGVQRLFRQYGEDSGVVFAWGAVLERLLHKDFEGAVQKREVARRHNPYVEAYLFGERQLPSRLSEFFSPGDESEAVVCTVLLAEAWLRHPAAWIWLRSLQPAAAKAGEVNFFDDPDACRWLDTLLGGSDSSPMVEVLHTPAYLPPEFVLRASVSREILVAAELVAACRGRTSLHLPRRAIEWLLARDLLVSPGVIRLAREAVALVRDRSELSHLWSASPQGQDWLRAVDELQQRLQEATPAD